MDLPLNYQGALINYFHGNAVTAVYRHRLKYRQDPTGDRLPALDDECAVFNDVLRCNALLNYYVTVVINISSISTTSCNKRSKHGACYNSTWWVQICMARYYPSVVYPCPYCLRRGYQRHTRMTRHHWRIRQISHDIFSKPHDHSRGTLVPCKLRYLDVSKFPYITVGTVTWSRGLRAPYHLVPKFPITDYRVTS